MTQIQFQDVLRDAVQSLFGTNPSAEEIIDAYPEAHRTGTASIQTGGGTFFDIFAKKGRDEWREVERLISHFSDLGIRQSALIRGDFLFGYEPQPYDVIKAMVFEFAEMGMNILQNFQAPGLRSTLSSALRGSVSLLVRHTLRTQCKPSISEFRGGASGAIDPLKCPPRFRSPNF